MSTLGTYKALVSEKMGTSSTSFATAQMRTDAINEAIGDICQEYDIRDLFKVATLTLTSGSASKPTDFMRMIKMWDATNPTPEYLYVSEDTFDSLATTASAYWTIDYDTSSSTRKIYVKPTSITSVRIRYLHTPTVLTVDADTSSLPSEFDDVVAYGAASILANNANDFNKMKAMDIQFNRMLSKVTGLKRAQGGIKAHTRLRSVFEKYPITGNNGQT